MLVQGVRPPSMGLRPPQGTDRRAAQSGHGKDAAKARLFFVSVFISTNSPDMI